MDTFDLVNEAKW